MPLQYTLLDIQSILLNLQPITICPHLHCDFKQERYSLYNISLYILEQSQKDYSEEKNLSENHRIYEKPQHISLHCKVPIQNIVYPVPDYNLYKSVIVEFCISASNSSLLLLLSLPLTETVCLITDQACGFLAFFSLAGKDF